jgi:hypothetical protein
VVQILSSDSKTCLATGWGWGEGRNDNIPASCIESKQALNGAGGSQLLRRQRLGDQFEASPGNSLQNPILKNPSQKRTGGVVQGVGPEFKPQQCKKKSKLRLSWKMCIFPAEILTPIHIQSC